MADDSNENDSVMSPQHEAIDENQEWWLKFVPKCNEWTDVNISRFLNIYKAHSILWDPTHSFYTDEPKRMRAYATISKNLNLHGVKKRECIELIGSLKSLYAEEKERQATAKGCSQKYSPPPSWYSIFEDLTECVRRRLRECANTGSVQVEPTKPWKACCPRSYNEDIWTPKHFGTNVSEWFLTSHDEQLLCTCEESLKTKSEDVSSTENSCTCDRNSGSNSSSGIVQCGGKKTSHSSISCCCGTHSFIKQLKQCGRDVTERTSASITPCQPKNRKAPKPKIIEYCSEELRDDQRPSAEEICCADRTDLEDSISYHKTEETKCRKKKKQSRNEKRFSSGESEKKINCGEEPDRQKDSESLLLCEINDASVSKNMDTTEIICGIGYCSESLPCGGDRDINHRSLRQSATCPSEPDVPPESCRIRTSNPCRTSNSETSSSSESHNACCSPSDSNTTPVTASNSSSRDRKSVCSRCASIPERQESDHRLDYLNDPTLCEICAVKRVIPPRAYENVVQSEDPRIQELDKYCRYKDWDAIYNIRSQVSDEDPATIAVDEDLPPMNRWIDAPSSPTRHNHSPTEADINLFIDPKSSKAREVSLKHEYKWENGMNFKINQPRHYACEVSQVPGHEPAQLIL